MLRSIKTTKAFPLYHLGFKILLIVILFSLGIQLKANDTSQWQKKLLPSIYYLEDHSTIDSLIEYYYDNNLFDQYIDYTLQKISYLQYKNNFREAQITIELIRNSLDSFYQKNNITHYTKKSIDIDLAVAAQGYVLDIYEHSLKAYIELKKKVHNSTFDSLYKQQNINVCNLFIAYSNYRLDRHNEALSYFKIISDFSKIESGAMAKTAQLYMKIGEIEKAEIYAEKAWNSIKYSKSKISSNSTYISLLEFYMSNNNTRKVNEITEFLKENIKRDLHRFNLETLNFNFHLSRNEIEKAKELLFSIQLPNQLISTSSIKLNHQKIKYHLKVNDFKNAEKHLQMTFDTLKINSIENMDNANIPLNNIDLLIESLAYGLEIQNAKLARQKGKNDTTLAQNYADEMYDFIIGARSKIRSDLDKKFSNVQFEHYYNMLIDFAYLKDDSDLMWKYLSLANNYSISFTRLLRSFQMENSSVEEIAKSKTLYHKIIDLESDEIKYPDSIEIVNKLIKQRAQYHKDGKVENINSNLEYKLRANNLKTEVQNKLKDNESIISFYTTEEFIYRIVVTSESSQIKRIPMLQNIQESIVCLSDFNCDYEPAVQSLSAILQGVKLKERITIIPHGILNCIPFDALFDGQGKPLIYNHTISYQYKWDSKNQDHSALKFTAIAPSFNDTCGTFSPLDFNSIESKEIAEALTLYIDTISYDIDKNTFFEKCLSTDILHFASHTFIDNFNPQKSYLSLGENCQKDIEGSKIFINDILTKTLSNELIVLSSCDSGNGKLVKGEGLESLSKAFFKSNVKSIISTLWSANDHSTSVIMKYFYKNLNKGESKDVALKNAKIKFRSEFGPDYYHPYFWAGFVPFGDMSPIIKNKNHWIYVCLSAFLIIVLYFIKKKTSNSVS